MLCDFQSAATINCSGDCSLLFSVWIQCGAHPSLSLLAFCYHPSWVSVTKNDPHQLQQCTDLWELHRLNTAYKISKDLGGLKKDKSNGRHELKIVYASFPFCAFLGGSWELNREQGRGWITNHTVLPPSIWACSEPLKGQNSVKLSLQCKDMTAALRVLQVYTKRHRTVFGTQIVDSIKIKCTIILEYDAFCMFLAFAATGLSIPASLSHSPWHLKFLMQWAVCWFLKPHTSTEAGLTYSPSQNLGSSSQTLPESI